MNLNIIKWAHLHGLQWSMMFQPISTSSSNPETNFRLSYSSFSMHLMPLLTQPRIFWKTQMRV